MNEACFESEIFDAIQFNEECDITEEIRSVETFEEAGVLTTDRGLVIKLSDKSVFHLTIKKVR
jgi:hypothetical protein